MLEGDNVEFVVLITSNLHGIVLLSHIYFNSQRRMATRCDGIKPHKPGFDVSSERMLHNIVVICVAWEHLRMNKTKETFHVIPFRGNTSKNPH